MSDRARFFLSVRAMCDQHEHETGLGRRGCIRHDQLTYWLARCREDAAWLIGATL